MSVKPLDYWCKREKREINPEAEKPKQRRRGTGTTLCERLGQEAEEPVSPNSEDGRKESGVAGGGSRSRRRLCCDSSKTEDGVEAQFGQKRFLLRS